MFQLSGPVMPGLYLSPFNPDYAQTASEETFKACKKDAIIESFQIDNVFSSFFSRNDDGAVFVVATRILSFACLLTNSCSSYSYS